VDLDEMVAARAGASVEEIFRLRGQDGFRSLETLCLMEVLNMPGPLVAALGGGTLLSPGNLKAVADRAVIFTLDPGETELESRIAPGRPLSGNPLELRELMAIRRDHYRSLPGRVDIRGLSPSEAAGVIAGRIRPAPKTR
jgi:shikimate kinase